MILRLLMETLYQIFNAIFSLLPDVTSVNLIDDSIVDFLANIVNTVGYFLPLPTMLLILTLTLSIRNFHIIWAIIKRVWAFIPVVGS